MFKGKGNESNGINFISYIHDHLLLDGVFICGPKDQ